MWVKYDSKNSNILIDSSANEFTDLIHNQEQVDVPGWQLPMMSSHSIWRFDGIDSVEPHTVTNLIPYLVSLKPDVNYRLYKYMYEDHARLVNSMHLAPFGFDYIINVDPKMKKTTEDFDANGFLSNIVWSVWDWDLEEVVEELLKVTIVYDLADDAALQAAKTVLGRTVTRQWILEDGTYKADLSDTKVTKKTYDSHLHRKDQGEKRRHNIAAFTEEAFVTLVMILHTAGDQEAAEGIGKLLMGQYLSEFGLYLDVGHDALITAIEAHAGDAAEAALDVVVPDAAPANVLYPTAVGQTIRAYIADRYRGIAI